MAEAAVYPYRPNADQRPGRIAHHPVMIVGAGPIGLAMAIDLASKGQRSVVLDDNDGVSEGSRAICWAKRTLEILDRLGVADRMVAKGVTWNLGKVYFRDELVYSFNLQPEGGHKHPAFINLQQYYAEQYLVERAAETGLIEVRGRNRLTGVTARADGVEITVETPDGPYPLSCDWLIAADGARSAVRTALGLEFQGRAFEDRFLIADVKMLAEFPTERWFWFDPPFNPGQSALLHRQPDNVWRIDLQLGRDADPIAERAPERILPRVRAMLGHGDFELEWASIYSFQCRRLERFVHGRVLFAGDSAHQVSPFGARGANSGIQDVDNLAWKLDLVMRGLAPAALLESYNDERVFAAEENILASTRATDFISPKGEMSLALRNGVLELAKTDPAFRPFINSGRLSVPAVLNASPLNSVDQGCFEGGPVAGSPAPDVPASPWLSEQLDGRFTLLSFGADLPTSLATLRLPTEGLAAERYDARPGTAYLLRPDGHVAARAREPDAGWLEQALDRAHARETSRAFQAAGQ